MKEAGSIPRSGLWKLPETPEGDIRPSNLAMTAQGDLPSWHVAQYIDAISGRTDETVSEVKERESVRIE